MKIGILHNCIQLGLANAIRAIHPDCEVVNFEFGAVQAKKIEAEVIAAFETCDAVITAPLPPSAGLISLEELKAKLPRLVATPGILFAGFHPDVIYIKGESGWLGGVTGDYRSRIATVGYVCGLSVKETARMFNALAFARLGYFHAFANACDFMLRRFSNFGIDAKPCLEKWLKQGCFMHSPNHAKVSAVFDLAVMACDKLGIKSCVEPGITEMIPDHMVFYAKHPVFPEIGRRLGIEGHSNFKPSVSAALDGFRLLPLHKFIEAEFEIYQRQPMEMLRQADGVEHAVSALKLTLKTAV